MKLLIQEGQRFTRLTVIKELPVKRIPSGQINRNFLCKCDCGTEKEVRLVHLSRGRIVSCGCYKNTRDGLGNSLLLKVWRQIKYRCLEGSTESKVYFKKGITVCDEWNGEDHKPFVKWSLENGYKKGLQIDREDNSKGYSPDNCRWVDPIVNQNNKDNTFFVNYKTEKVAFSLLLRDKGLFNHSVTIRRRIKRGWSVEDAFDKPLREGNYKRKFKK